MKKIISAAAFAMLLSGSAFAANTNDTAAERQQSYMPKPIPPVETPALAPMESQADMRAMNDGRVRFECRNNYPKAHPSCEEVSKK